jgi:ribosomal protein L20
VYRLIAVTKILARAKGYYGARSRVYRVAFQAVIKAGQYAYRDRRQKNVNSVLYGLRVSMLVLVLTVCLTAV